MPQKDEGLLKWRHFWSAFSLLSLLFALVDTFSLLTPEQMAAGQPFIYGLFVNRTNWAWGLVLGVVLSGVWLSLRGVLRALYALNGFHLSVLWIAIVLVCLVNPLRLLAQPAVHHQRAVAPSGQVYQLFYQHDGWMQSTCRYTVARCDVWGITCQTEQSWQMSAVCLGTQAPFSWQIQAGRLVLMWADERLADYP